GIVFGILEGAGAIDGTWQARIVTQSPLTWTSGILATLAYHTASESIGGASIGKALCGLRVLSVDGTPCTVRGAFIRSLAFYVDACCFGIVAYSTMSGTLRKQRLGDRWGDTLVVHVPSLPSNLPSRVLPGIVTGLFLW